MKHIAFTCLLAGALALPAGAAKSPVPQAPVITYGLIRDEYGAPLTRSSSASLALVRSDDRAGRVYATSDVGDSGVPGMNYRLSLEIDSSGPSRSYAVLAGTEMFAKATLGSVVTPMSPVATFVTPPQGTSQRLDFSFGADADGDGMPDDWEAWQLDLAGRGSSPAGIAAFRPEDDADGDGMTNLQEYFAGTKPFLATDLLKITSIEVVPGTGRVKIAFTTTVKRTFRVLMTESLEKPNWTPVATTRDEGGELVYEDYPGTGRTMTVYADARLSSMFFRVAAN